MPSATKGSAYAKRNEASIPAPLGTLLRFRHARFVTDSRPEEEDSDPDFRPGPIIEEPKLKRKRKSSSSSPRKRTQSTHGQRRTSGTSSDLSKFSLSRDNGIFSYTNKNNKGARYANMYGPNPLLEYFNTSLDLHSESEDDADDEDEDDEDDEEEEDEEDQEESDENSDDSIPRKTFPKNTQKTDEKPANAASSSQKEVIEVEDDSVTESESEVESGPFLVSARKPSPRNSSQNDPNEDSVTEPETDDESQITARPFSPKKVASQSQSQSDSETEPESDSESLANQDLEPRPGFPLAPGQSALGPLVLDNDKKIAVPASINTYLRDYQREGIKFFWKQYSEGRGGLLGDDMGLGKTIQVISFLSGIMKKSGTNLDSDRRQQHVSRLQDLPEWKEKKVLPAANATWPTCLIIAPSTVVHNWQREFETWGYFEVGMYNGNKKEREQALRDFKLGRLDVVLTTFDLARRDIDLLDTLPWSCIFVDEVHRVKNEGSKITKAYHRFLCTRRFGLTGTAIQNSYKEMWTILDWTNPGRLGSGKQWNGYVVRPLTVGQSAGASEEERATALEVALILRDKLLPNFFLRRTKEIIRDQLPEKSDQVVFCPLTDRQITVYKNILNMPSVRNLTLKDKRCECGSGKRRKACCHPTVPGDVFKFMSVLIKLANHLALILPSPTDSVDQLQRNRMLAQLAFPDCDPPKYGTAILRPEFCGKWEVLELLLKEWRRDRTNKVLIFTKSVKLLDMLDFHLNSQSFGFLRLDGTTKQSERMPMIDRFNKDPKIFIFLISTLAGGTGLNLTGANKVVIFDPNWNPAHDLQAMDRAFRFGQTRNVAVYRLLGAGSIEELIYARQIYKQQQMAIGYEASVQTRYFEGVQGDNSKKGELFGIENIFKLHEDKLATKMAIEKATTAELDWALANMSAPKSKKRTKPGTEDWAEAEKSSKDKDDSGFQGLGTLLFDDEPPPASNQEEDFIKKTLNTIGVKYSHHNDQILVPSRIEEERLKNLLKTRKQRTKIPLTNSKSRTSSAKHSPKKSKAPWPPIRKNHARPSPDAQLASRRQALIELGMIKGPGDIATFAREFATQSPDEQQRILAELDRYMKERPPDSD